MKLTSVLTSIAIALSLISLWLNVSTKTETRTEVIEIEKQAKPLTEWQVMELAMMEIESNYRTDKVGKSHDVGVLQITPIYVKEANRLKGGEVWTHEDCKFPSVALEIFEYMNDIKNPERDIEKAIRLHNPRGAAIGYPQRVKDSMERIRRYEEMRNLITEK